MGKDEAKLSVHNGEMLILKKAYSVWSVVVTVEVLVKTLPLLSTFCDTTLITMVALPPPTKVTLPAASTVATLGLLEEYEADCIVNPFGADGIMAYAAPIPPVVGSLAAGTGVGGAGGCTGTTAGGGVGVTIGYPNSFKPRSAQSCANISSVFTRASLLASLYAALFRPGNTS